MVLVRSWGGTVITARESGLIGCQNGEVLTYAQQHQLVFLTRDKDFTDIRVYPPADLNGIIVLKISPSNQSDVHAMLQKLLSTLSPEELHAKLAIVDRKKCRIVDGTDGLFRVIR